jgi:hypothetical protein
MFKFGLKLPFETLIWNGLIGLDLKLWQIDFDFWSMLKFELNEDRIHTVGGPFGLFALKGWAVLYYAINFASIVGENNLKFLKF